MENYGVKNRNKKSIERICIAMFEILKEKNFDNISITEICAKAQIARKTFYRNFNNKEEVIQATIDLKLSEFNNDGILEQVKHPSNLTEKYFEFWYERRDFLKILYEKNLFTILNYKYDVYMRQLRKKFNANEEDSIELEYFLKFISGGFWNVLQTWIRRDFKESPQEMTELTTMYMERLKLALESNTYLYDFDK
ncbi:MAG: TetR/AcrR family transcriptional regulator [Sarcina sp.]